MPPGISETAGGESVRFDHGPEGLRLRQPGRTGPVLRRFECRRSGAVLPVTGPVAFFKGQTVSELLLECAKGGAGRGYDKMGPGVLRIPFLYKIADLHFRDGVVPVAAPADIGDIIGIVDASQFVHISRNEAV